VRPLPDAPRWQDISKWDDSRIAALARTAADRLKGVMVPAGKLFARNGHGLHGNGRFSHDQGLIRRNLKDGFTPPSGTKVSSDKFFWTERSIAEYEGLYVRPDYLVDHLLDPCPIRNASYGLAPDPSGMRVTAAQQAETLAWISGWSGKVATSAVPTYRGCHAFYHALSVAADALGLVRDIEVVW